MNQERNQIIRIILNIVFVLIIIASICVFIPLMHNLKLAEMSAQIEQFGFYKGDFWVSVERYKKDVGYSIGLVLGILLPFFGIMANVVWAICED